jgi:hypothetical protein
LGKGKIIFFERRIKHIFKARKKPVQKKNTSNERITYSKLKKNLFGSKYPRKRKITKEKERITKKEYPIEKP